MNRKVTLIALGIFAASGILFAQDVQKKVVELSPDLQRKAFQFTFMFPPLSTNWVQNSRTINNLSLNLFVGHAGGVDGMELGGFINTINYHARGFQGAGFGNVVGTSVDGIQLAGFFNVNGTNARVLQSSGFINVCGGNFQGAQLAGFLNITGCDTRGFQGAGFGNVTGESTRGAQLAGFMNVGGNVKGAQIAGFLNVADSLDGIPIGFINVVVKNGYRQFEFSVSETQYANFSYRMGVRKLYNIYSFSRPAGPGSRWLLGFGLGGELDLNQKVMMNLEALVNQEIWIAEPAVNSFCHIDRLNLLNQFRVLFAFKPSDKVSLFVGPTFNVAVAEPNPDIGYLPWYEIGPKWAFFNRTYDNESRTNVKMWIGVTGGVRLGS